MSGKRRKSFASAVLPLLLGFLLVGGNRPGNAQESEAIKQFQYAARLYEDGLLDLAATQFEDYLQRFPDSPRIPEVYLKLGKIYAGLNNVEKSNQALRALLVQFPEFPRCDQAWFALAENHVADNDSRQAAELLERFPLFYPESPLAPAALLRAGDLWFQRSEFVRAVEDWQRVCEEFPGSEKVPVARLRLAGLFLQQRRLSKDWPGLAFVIEAAPCWP